METPSSVNFWFYFRWQQRFIQLSNSRSAPKIRILLLDRRPHSSRLRLTRPSLRLTFRSKFAILVEFQRRQNLPFTMGCHAWHPFNSCQLDIFTSGSRLSHRLFRSWRSSRKLHLRQLYRRLGLIHRRTNFWPQAYVYTPVLDEDLWLQSPLRPRGLFRLFVLGLFGLFGCAMRLHFVDL